MSEQDIRQLESQFRAVFYSRLWAQNSRSNAGFNPFECEGIGSPRNLSESLWGFRPFAALRLCENPFAS